MSTVIYVGGSPEVVDTEGRTYPRGERVEVPEGIAESLGPDFRVIDPTTGE